MSMFRMFSFAALAGGLISGCGPSSSSPGEDGGTGNDNQLNNNTVSLTCGNGVIEAGEQCDDGNVEDCDGCSPTCQIETGGCCGNGVLEPGEECDDGNNTAGDGCDEICRLEICGNSRLDTGEDCDDGNTTGGDGCNQVCLFEECDNGVMDVGEECDANDFGGATCETLGYYYGQLACDASCLYDESGCGGACGDGWVDVPFEQCDDGNLVGGDGCNHLCQAEPGACLVDEDLGVLTQGGVLNGTVDTNGSHAMYESSCATAIAAERVLSFTNQQYLDVTIDFSGQTGRHIVGLFRDNGNECDAVELLCLDTNADPSGTLGTLTLGAGTYYIIVDSSGAGDEGSVTVTVTGAQSSLPCDAQFGDDGVYIGCTLTGMNFEDIQSTGTLAVASDDSHAFVPVGFAFNFYGTDYTDVAVQTNGAIGFTNAYISYSYAASCMPSASVTQPLIAVFWDDLDSGNGGAGHGVYYETRGAAPYRYLIVQWITEHYSTSSEGRFQAVLYETTNHIEVRYLDVDFGNPTSYDNGISAALGIQQSTTAAMQYSCNTASITSGDTLMYYRQ
ncbi:MAG: DUF4215 domain-containing protein [bacterium]